MPRGVPCQLADVQRVEARERLERRALGHDHAWTGIGDNVADFPFAIEDVDRDENHPELETGEQDVDELDAIGEIDGEPIAGLQPAPGQQVCKAIAAGVQVAEAQRGDPAVGTLELDCHLVCLSHEGRRKQIHQLHRARSYRGNYR